MPLRLDPLTSDLFDCLHETHERIRFERDPLRFCQALDIQYVLGPSNMARVARWQSGPDLIVVRHEQHTSRDLFTIAHEAAPSSPSVRGTSGSSSATTRRRT